MSKKSLIVIVILILLLTVSGIFNFTLNNKLTSANAKTEEAEKLYEDSYAQVYSKLTALNYSEFQKKVESGEEFYVYVGRPNCGDCRDAEEFLINLIDLYHLETKLYYFNCKELRADEAEWENFKAKYEIQFTPTFAKFKDGKIENKSEWTEATGYSEDMFKEWLSLNNLK